MAKQEQPIIIKRIKKADHGHHGGAWKIAYADFVTAMMAFFLLMWLISMTTEEQKKGLAEYFAPEAASTNSSGAGGVLGGSSLDDAGSLRSGYSPKETGRTPSTPKNAGKSTTGDEAGERAGQDGGAYQSTGQSEYDSVDTEAFHSAAASIRQALQSLPEVTPFQDNVLVEVTKDGLDILITDLEGRPMFAKGSRYPLEPTRALIAAIAPTLQQLNAKVTIYGHTAAGGRYDDVRYGPWELSADRANTVRFILTQFGLSDERIASVIGRAATDPYFIDDPYMAANERVRISVLFPPPPVPVGWKP